mmetsp:Transcript_17879/g.27081  ORF Transcript_17879/g.27081 Transcript_17879/m.27081 type:complete len:90 (-) Transcript_17879:311-580(-)
MAEAMVADDKARSIAPVECKASSIAISTFAIGILLVQELPACFLTLAHLAYNDIYLPFATTHYEILCTYPMFYHSSSSKLIYASRYFVI